MDNQPNDQKSIKETSTSSTPIIPETQVPDNIENPISTMTEVSTSETELSPSQPETLPQPEPEIEETNSSEYQNEYQDVLNQYAANQETIKPTLEPENETPIAPIIPDSNIIPSPPQNNLFKIIFIISLIIFILTATVLAFVYFKNQKGSSTINNQSSTTENPTPTISSSDTCFLNDKTYQAGETFTATDGCNTCTCVSQNNISCTEKECSSSKSATNSASQKESTSSATQGTSLLKISDIQMNIPGGWEISSVTKNTAKILTDYKQYKVYLNLTLSKNDAGTESNYDSKNSSVETNFGEAYLVSQGGAFGVTGAVINKNKYSFEWEIESNQKPTYSDGVWVPDNNVTKKILLDITETAKPL